jgi:hypothetical protein
MSSDTNLLSNSERFIIYPVFYAISLALRATLTLELRRRPGLHKRHFKEFGGTCSTNVLKAVRTEIWFEKTQNNKPQKREARMS